MKSIHVVAGIVLLLTGLVALVVRKGSRLHRGSGQLFILAMLMMTSSAMFIALFVHPNRVNVVAAMITGYLVLSAFVTVRPTVPYARAWTVLLMALALSNGVYAARLGVEGLLTPKWVVDRVPAPMVLIFASVSLLAGLSDLRVLKQPLQSATARLRRHLWRMGFAMWIATASAFLGQAKFFPLLLRQSGALVVPVIVLPLLLLFWLWRSRRANPDWTPRHVSP